MRARSFEIALTLVTLGCSESGATTKAQSAGASGDASADVGAPPEFETPWEPGVVYPSFSAERRGLLDVRGLIHTHSVHSHDACDDTPRLADGGVNLPCLEDFRDGFCHVRHDFVMLTDHDTHFSELSLEQAVLFDRDRGDELVERGGGVTAAWQACPGGHRTLMVPGTESALMPVGIEREGLAPLYTTQSVESVEQLQAAGAVVFVSHTEDYTADDLVRLPLDGFEMYNIHANLLSDVSRAVPLLAAASDPTKLMHSDLVILGMITEDPAYLDTWSQVLSRGARRVTFMATDAHRNSLPMLLPDGERVDSFRRLASWFSNHLLVRPGASQWSDRELKEALRAGRLYGVFEVLGYADGFDYTATTADGTTHEMGQAVSVAAGVTLHVSAPSVAGLPATVSAPELTVRLLRASESGWVEVAAADADLEYSPTEPGAYRAEVRIRPLHLRGSLNDFASLADEDFVWVYGNAVYVTD